MRVLVLPLRGRCHLGEVVLRQQEGPLDRWQLLKHWESRQEDQQLERALPVLTATQWPVLLLLLRVCLQDPRWEEMATPWVMNPMQLSPRPRPPQQQEEEGQED